MNLQIRTAVRLPVHARDWRLMARAVRRVLSQRRYVGLLGVSTVLALSAIAVAQNGELFVRVVVLGRLPLSNRLHVLAAMYPFLGTTFEFTTAVSVLALSTLVGLDVTMLLYHFREHGVSAAVGASGTAGTAGALVGALGAGCVVCGTSLLAGLISLVGVPGGVVVALFEGLGVTLLAAALVGLSLFWTAEGMHGGMRKRELAERSDR